MFDDVSQAWQTSVDRWHVGMCDLSGGQGLLAQVEGRTAQVVRDWLAQRSQARRDQVRYVAIYMCTIFKSAVREALPHATLVVDHFHVVQLEHQPSTRSAAGSPCRSGAAGVVPVTVNGTCVTG